MPTWSILNIFANRVHVSNHWLPVQTLAYTPVPNYDTPWVLHCDYFDQWFVTNATWTSWPDSGHNLTFTNTMNTFHHWYESLWPWYSNLLHVFHHTCLIHLLTFQKGPYLSPMPETDDGGHDVINNFEFPCNLMKNIIPPISIWNFANTVIKNVKWHENFNSVEVGHHSSNRLRRYLRYFRGTHRQSSLSHRLLAFYTWMNHITECLYGVYSRSHGIGKWLKGLICGHVHYRLAWHKIYNRWSSVWGGGTQTWFW